MLKTALTLALAFVLSGCVTYYYPAPSATVYNPYDSEDEGVYYAEDDPQVRVSVGIQANYGFGGWWYSGFGAYVSGYGWRMVYHYPYYDIYDPWYGGWPAYWGVSAYYYRPYPWYRPWVYQPVWYYHRPYYARPHYAYGDHGYGHRPHHDPYAERYHRSVERHGPYSARNPRTAMSFTDRNEYPAPAVTPGERRWAIGDRQPRDPEDGRSGRSPGIAANGRYEQRVINPSSRSADSNMVVRSRGNMKPGVSRTQPTPGISRTTQGTKRTYAGESRTQPVTTMPRRVISDSNAGKRPAPRGYTPPVSRSQPYSRPSKPQPGMARTQPAPGLSRTQPVPKMSPSRTQPRTIQRSAPTRSAVSRPASKPARRAAPSRKSVQPRVRSKEQD